MRSTTGLLVLIAAVAFSTTLEDATASAAETTCGQLLQDYKAYTTQTEAVPYQGDNMLFFLHIPRTAGGTLNCLLRAAIPAEQRCPRAYQGLPNATALSNCSLVASHDDFSAMQHLPANTAVISELRDPVDRVLSAYEFAIEQAAQRLNKTLQATAKHLSEALAFSLTDDVWPWNYLVPFFADDITPKLAALKAVPLKPPGVWTIQRNDDGTLFYWNKLANSSKASLTEEEQQYLVPELDAYNNDIVMSLEEFIHHPIASELLHNGELLQVLGLTNNSFWPQASKLRSCMLKDDSIAEELLQLGLQRIERFAYLGVTSQLTESVEMMVSSLGWSFNQTSHPLTEEEVLALVADASPLEEQKAGLLQQYRDYIKKEGDQPLGTDYHKCAAAGKTSGRKRRSRQLRKLRLNDWRQIYFDKSDRQAIPVDLINEIRHLNALDQRLFERAAQIMAQQRQQLEAAGKLQRLPPAPAGGQTAAAPDKGQSMEMFKKHVLQQVQQWLAGNGGKSEL